MRGHTSTDKIRRPAIIRVLLLCALLGALPVQAQVNDPAYADYFLVGRFGEICTMCEVTVLCEAGDTDRTIESIDDATDFTLYHLHTRTFWSQISTIWEWFIANFDSASLAQSGHERPVRVIEVSGGEWQTPVMREARISLDPGVIVIGARTIDRTNRRWLEEPDQGNGGYCHRLPLWDTLAVIEARTGEPSS